jgi:hypothetical protein
VKIVGPASIRRQELESASLLDQNFVLAGVIRQPNDAFKFHLLNQ